MSNMSTIDCICHIRDILEYKQYDKLKASRCHFEKLFKSVHRDVKAKTENPKLELDFCAQDLRELAKDISDTLKRWDHELDPERNIKKLKKQITPDGKLDFNDYFNNFIRNARLRCDHIQILTELRNIIEHHAVYLYWLEEESMDPFALQYSKRF